MFRWIIFHFYCATKQRYQDEYKILREVKKRFFILYSAIFIFVYVIGTDICELPILKSRAGVDFFFYTFLAIFVFGIIRFYRVMKRYESEKILLEKYVRTPKEDRDTSVSIDKITMSIALLLWVLALYFHSFY